MNISSNAMTTIECPVSIVLSSPSTNWIFRIDSSTSETCVPINGEADEGVILKTYSLVFCNMESQQFKENLEFIDSMMPEILAHLLEISYTQGIRKVSEAVRALSEKNPIGYSNNKIYEYKVKKFLAACALGMTPERVWEGVEDANGGYIVVKQDGSVLCYHLYDRSEFEQYLFDYTVFEKASTSRHGFMNIFEENGQFKIKLNLQVRFV